MTDFTLDEARTEMMRLSRAIDAGIDYSKQHAVELAGAENLYRKAKAEGWLKCPRDEPGEREWTAARREAWVDAHVADNRKARDLAEAMRDAAREAVRARQAQVFRVADVGPGVPGRSRVRENRAVSDQLPLFEGFDPREDPIPAQVVNVHFEDLEGLRQFAALTGLPIHERTRAVWYDPPGDGQ